MNNNPFFDVGTYEVEFDAKAMKFLRKGSLLITCLPNAIQAASISFG